MDNKVVPKIISIKKYTEADFKDNKNEKYLLDSPEEEQIEHLRKQFGFKSGQTIDNI